MLYDFVILFKVGSRGELPGVFLFFLSFLLQRGTAKARRQAGDRQGRATVLFCFVAILRNDNKQIVVIVLMVNNPAQSTRVIFNLARRTRGIIYIGQSRATLSYSFVNADQGADILYMSIEPEQGDGLPCVNGRH